MKAVLMNDRVKSIGDVTLMALLQSSVDTEVTEDAAAQFYARYMEKLMSLVERNLASKFSSRVDPEDIVQSIFRSWFRGARDGRIQPSSRGEIWKLLSVVALNKVRNKVKFHERKRRAVSNTKAGNEVLSAVPDPTQADAVAFLDLVAVAGNRLDEMGRRTLELILAGKSVEEIAIELGRTTKSVSRYKKRVGKVLQGLLDDDLKRLEADEDFAEDA
jgi:RNA polymerase sigma-70 factor, ECF subfamily